MWWLLLLQVFTIWATNLGLRNGNIFKIKMTEDYTQHQPLQSTKESLKDKNTIQYDPIQLFIIHHTVLGLRSQIINFWTNSQYT